MISHSVLLLREGGDIEAFVELCKWIFFPFVCHPPPMVEQEVILIERDGGKQRVKEVYSGTLSKDTPEMREHL
jgi:hypothetical protein